MDITQYIKSGVLEEFVLGTLSNDNNSNVIVLSNQHPRIKEELNKIEEGLKQYLNQYALTPPKNLKAIILQLIDEEELLAHPPILNINSKISDYNPWLNKIKEAEEYDNLHMEVIGNYENATMVIAWIKEGEIDHEHNEYSENFLIVEGSCIATIGNVTSNYGVGDYVHFPVNLNHSYKVTSNIPMKVIACLDLQAA